jgi:hypothetical protein
MYLKVGGFTLVHVFNKAQKGSSWGSSLIYKICGFPTSSAGICFFLSVDKTQKSQNHRKKIKI